MVREEVISVGNKGKLADDNVDPALSSRKIYAEGKGRRGIVKM